MNRANHYILIQSVGFTDHYMLSCNLNLRRVHRPVLEVKTQRSFKHFNANQFKELLYKTEIVTDPADDVDEYVRQYNDSISTVLDKLAPLKTVTNRRGKKNNTWLSEDAKEAKRKRRCLERRWCRTKSERDRGCLSGILSNCEHVNNGFQKELLCWVDIECIW